MTIILSMGRALAPKIGKTLGLAGLGGLTSEGASPLVKKISGGNIFTDAVDLRRKLEKRIKGGQVGGFLIPQNEINQLIVYKHLLNNNQKRDILNAPQTGSGVRIQPTRTQLGNGLGTVLATIGIPLAVELVKKITGRGAPRVGSYQKQDGHGAPRLGVYEPPPPEMPTSGHLKSGGSQSGDSLFFTNPNPPPPLPPSRAAEI